MPTFIRMGSQRAGIGFEIPDDPAACWPWRGALDQAGYGLSYSRHLGRAERAHRVVWAMLHGPAPRRGSGFELDHTCRNRRCVNPSHLELATVTENRARRDFSSQRRPITHGRASSYTSRKCRCDLCRAAWTAYLKARRRLAAGRGGDRSAKPPGPAPPGGRR